MYTRFAQRNPILTALLSVTFITFAAGHSWLDCLSPDPNVAGANGLKNDWVFSAANVYGVCDGYPRNYAPRNEGFTNEVNTKELFYVNMKNADFPVCVGQARSSYGGKRRMLKASPGTVIYMGYTENGHLTKLLEGVGTFITIYYRSDEQEISKVRDLSEIAAMVPFDDGKMCGEVSDRSGKPTGRTGRPCVQSFKIPEGLCPGVVYSFMWYWNQKGQAGYYSCFDVLIG